VRADGVAAWWNGATVTRIYLSPPDVGPRERKLLLEAFDSNWIAPLGPFVDAFETQLADYIGVGSAAALSSGTAGLHLALHLLGVGPGDDVIVPSLTFAASANAVTYTGARPVFIDSAADSWCIDPQLVADELDERARRGQPLPRALMTVDLYGQCADYEALTSMCDRYDVALIEDAAEALGSSHHGRRAGGFGRIGVFSFNGNKIITTSGGGMLVADDDAVVEQARHLATQARQPAAHYEHEEIGFNYRLSNLLAALGCAQLEQIDDKVARRTEINATYRDALADVPGLSFPPVVADNEPNHWLSIVLLDPTIAAATTDVVRVHLETLDIEARPTWKPMHQQPVYRSAPMRGGAVADQVFATGLCLPSGSSLTDDQQQQVIAGVRSVLVPATS
jgi:dTDP-4-amino-4,6-dideoxygalactose transaminase